MTTEANPLDEAALDGMYGLAALREEYAEVLRLRGPKSSCQTWPQFVAEFHEMGGITEEQRDRWVQLGPTGVVASQTQPPAAAPPKPSPKRGKPKQGRLALEPEVEDIDKAAEFDMHSLEYMRAEYGYHIRGPGQHQTWAAHLTDHFNYGSITRQQFERWLTLSPYDSDNPPPTKTPTGRSTMQLTENGLRIGKSELECLLAFSAKEAKSSFHWISIKAMRPPGEEDEPKGKGKDAPPVKDGKLKVRASTGQIAVDCMGLNLSKRAQEWLVNRSFLEAAKKLCTAEEVVVLKFKGASLREAAIEDSAGNELQTITWTNDAANSQTSYGDEEEWNNLLKLPTGSKGIKMLGLKSAAIPLINRLERVAANSEVQLFVNESDRMLAYASTDDTTWLAMVDPDPNASTDED